MKRIYYLLIAFCFIGFSCSPIYYPVTTQNVPLISKKQETNFEFGISPLIDQLYINGSYGITDYIGGMLNTCITSNLNTKYNRASSFFFELGCGPFYNLTPWLLVDIYPVFGVGWIDNHFDGKQSSYSNIIGDLSAHYLRFGFQPSITFHYDILALTFSAGLYQLSYHNIKGNLKENQEDQIQFLSDRRISKLIEPGITFSVTLNTFRIKFQALSSSNLTYNDIPNRKAALSISLGMSLVRKSKTESDKLKIK